TNEFLGWAGLKLITESINNHTNFFDLGYRFIKRYWGQGFASEAAAASLAYAFNVLGANEVYAHAHTENIASNKILLKTGLTLTASFVHHNITCNWYEIVRETFEHK
ncbi:MAG TPA: GNAT family N-acetyltransferase, partial [Niastella sp.]|nr:GNAT family N-acetyltransferase [Niastella sp.]